MSIVPVAPSLRPWVLVLLLVGLTSACGGGGGGGNGIETVNLFLALDRSGTILKTGAAYPAANANAGDGAAGPARGFVSFLHSLLPAGAQIVSATLDLRLVHGQGDPFGSLGSLLIDHVNIGAGFEGSDYGGGAIGAAIAAIPGPVALDAQMGILLLPFDVSDAVRADVTAGRVTSSFRFSFLVETDFDGATDDIWSLIDPLNDPTLAKSAILQVQFRR